MKLLRNEFLFFQVLPDLTNQINLGKQHVLQRFAVLGQAVNL
jgi:hypothetical protein